jgi:N-acetylmuramoyl-L-alanine amidase
MQFNKPKRAVTRVFLHHSGTNNKEWDSPTRIRTYHMHEKPEPKYIDIGYHFVITKNGVIHSGRSLETQPAAQYGHNKGTIAICLTGVDNGFTKEQKNSLVELCNSINEAYEKNITFHGHKEVYSTVCPHYQYKEWLNLSVDGHIQEKKKDENNFISNVLKPFTIFKTA